MQRAILAQRTLSPARPWLAPVVFAALRAALFVGGLALAVIRQRSGSPAGAIVFHWLAVVAMNAALFAQSR